jgi:amino acid transporter
MTPTPSSVSSKKPVDGSDSFTDVQDEQAFIFTEDRKLGFFSVVFLIVNAVMGTGIFSTPSIVFKTVNSVGSALMLWLVGAILTLCGFGDTEMVTNYSLLVYLEYGLAIPKSGGDKNYVCIDSSF